MTIRSCISSLLLLWPAFVPLTVIAQQSLSVADIAGRQISLELVTREDFSDVPWPDNNVAVVIEDVEIKDGDTIPRLLQARGIVPDNESYTLFYDLNPQLNSLDQIASQSKYKIPKVVGGLLLQEMLNASHFVLFTIDKDLKTELRNNYTAMVSMADNFNKVGEFHFIKPTLNGPAKRYVKDLAEWYERIYHTTARRIAKPLRRETLLQIVNESEALNTLLSKATNPTHKISATDCEQITSIHQDMEAIVDGWTEMMAGDQPAAELQYELEIVIKTRKRLAPWNLRVYYVMNGYYRPPLTNPPLKSSIFPCLRQRVSKALPVHKYKFWVAKDGKPGEPLSEPVEVTVDHNFSLEVSLR
jgi:hypothetical protein